MQYDKLIYGKNSTERIVSIEVEDDVALLFIEDEEGDVSTKEVSNKFWVLSNQPQGSAWTKLKGNLHFQYGRQCSTRQEFYKVRNQSKSSYDTFTITNDKESLMVKDGITYHKGMKPSEVSILSFDIETTGLVHDSTSKIVLISNTFRKNGKIIRKLFSYADYPTQGELLTTWCDWVREIDPSVICGHNIFSYDFKYMNYIAEQEDIELILGRNDSPLKIEGYDSKFRIDGSRDQIYNKMKIYGREIIDTYFLAVKYDVGRKYESYGLKNIIKQEGLEVKNRQFYDAATIKDNYTNPIEFEKIKAYAIFDADDSLALYDLMIPPFFYLSQTVPKSFQAMIESATGSQINSVMIRAYLQDAHSIPKASAEMQYEGAISFGNSGLFKNVFKVDVASLYPSIILEYEVYDERKDPNAYFLKLIQTFTERRLEHKKLAKTDKYYDDLQNAEKIFINSGYGFLGSVGLAFNSPANAGFITKTGREILQKSIQWAEWKKFKIVNADTDSISFCKPDMSSFSKDEEVSLLAELNDLYPERIKFEHDGIFEALLVVKAKNYVLVQDGKYKYKGSALKATGKEPALVEFIKKVIESLIKERSDLLSIYNTYVQEIDNITDIKRWGSKKSITAKVLNGTRTNESNIRNAIQGTDLREGDKGYFYFKEDGSLDLIQNFNGDYSKDKFYKKLFDTIGIFDTLIDVSIFKNYKLKRNKKELVEILNK